MENELEQDLDDLMYPMKMLGDEYYEIGMAMAQEHIDRAFNAGIEAALGALPEKRTDKVDASNLHTWGQMKEPQEGWSAACDQARAAIERLKK